MLEERFKKAREEIKIHRREMENIWEEDRAPASKSFFVQVYLFIALTFLIAIIGTYIGISLMPLYNELVQRMGMSDSIQSRIAAGFGGVFVMVTVTNLCSDLIGKKAPLNYIGLFICAFVMGLGLAPACSLIPSGIIVITEIYAILSFIFIVLSMIPEIPLKYQMIIGDILGVVIVVIVNFFLGLLNNLVVLGVGFAFLLSLLNMLLSKINNIKSKSYDTPMEAAYGVFETMWDGIFTFLPLIVQKRK
ncbi:Bax inhibitor 1 family protein [Campylobacter aviculae]|uniref:Uncharacterized protein n=1 Tax=Campylobacter aviculae TaxID=2510190 RepID=A0A4U7BJX0_9BACT|nr:US12 family protein [Campylobacter aviculae]TKX30741.1 hypothetical protein CQA76_07545 [Campylobacter aviculae]